MTPRHTIVDLSHRLSDGMLPFPGFPPLRIRDYLTHEASRDRYEGKAEFLITEVQAVGCVGTYLDSPRHRFPEGDDLAAVPLSHLAGLPGLLIDMRGDSVTPWTGPIGWEDIQAALAVVRCGLPAAAEVDSAPGLRTGEVSGLLEVTGSQDAAGASATASVGGAAAGGPAVLVRTGWDERFDSAAYWERPPYLTAAAAEALAAAQVTLVGVDFGNVDDTGDPIRPVHTTLLQAGIPIVENLTGVERLVGRRFRFFAAPLALRGGGSFAVRAFAEVEGPEA